MKNQISSTILFLYLLELIQCGILDSIWKEKEDEIEEAQHGC